MRPAGPKDLGPAGGWAAPALSAQLRRLSRVRGPGVYVELYIWNIQKVERGESGALDQPARVRAK